MALRVVGLVGKFSQVRQFMASPRLMDVGAKGVSGPGGSSAQSEGVTDMNSGDRESVTEGSEGPKDVAESIQQHQDAGKSDETEGLKGKPAGGLKDQVPEDVAGTGAGKHSQVGSP